jgi:hypothetical protein
MKEFERVQVERRAELCAWLEDNYLARKMEEIAGRM